MGGVTQTIISLSTAASSRGGMNMTVEDATSGTVLARVELTGEQAWRLFQGTTLNVRGETATDLTRVGLHRHNEAINVPREVWQQRSRADDQQAVEEWLTENKPPHWQAYRIDHRNYGWVTVGYWWDGQPPERSFLMVDGEDVPA